jgi:hypothetical protein
MDILHMGHNSYMQTKCLPVHINLNGALLNEITSTVRLIRALM